jgi:hypothetical protein
LRRLAGILAGLILTAPPALAGPPALSLPVDCTLGQTCFIQQYVDRDPGSGARDFTCGGLSYDGHKGTDFALPDVLAALSGVAVLASAPGTVAGLRDGEADHFDDDTATGTPGRDCGNGVVVDHGDGWESQYCHMRNGSISVAVGQSVVTGTPLGLVGMSGRAAFPHLHLSLRRDGAVVDPFDPGEIAACGKGRTPLWQDRVPYTAGGLVSAGMSDGVPEFGTIKAGAAHQPTLAGDAAALVFWAQVYGTREGDVLRLLISGPDGVFLDQKVTLERAQARAFRAAGRKLAPRTRRPGTYTGTAILERDGTEIGRMTATTSLGE